MKVAYSGLVDFQKVYLRQYGLQKFAEKILGFKIRKDQRRGLSWTRMPFHTEQLQYGADDVWVAWEIIKAYICSCER